MSYAACKLAVGAAVHRSRLWFAEPSSPIAWSSVRAFQPPGPPALHTNPPRYSGPPVPGVAMTKPQVDFAACAPGSSGTSVNGVVAELAVEVYFLILTASPLIAVAA